MRQTVNLMGVVLTILGTSSAAAQRTEFAPTWTLVEDLRIGEDAGPKSFNDVRGIVAAKNGNIFVLDFKTREIRLFDPKGNFLKLVSRDGAGPGEIRNANGLAIGKDDVIWVNDPSNGRFSQFGPDGRFLRQTLIPIQSYGYIWEAAIDDKGRAIDPAFSITTAKVDPQTGQPVHESRIRFIQADGKADTVGFPTCPVGPPSPAPIGLRFERSDKRGSMGRTIPFMPRQQIALTRSGMVWCSATSEYRLSVGPVGGALKEVIKLPVAPLPVTPEVRKRELEVIDSITRFYGPLTRGDPQSIPKTQPVIAKIHADDQSRVWVRLTSLAEATPSYDVYDTSGKQVARVRSTGKVGTQAFIAGGNLYTVIMDEDDVPVIVRFRIVR